MNSYLLGLLVVVGSTILAVAGMLLVRKRIDLTTLNSYHEVAGYFLSIVGTLYAVLLGFVIVDAMNNLQNARVTAEQEANALCNIFVICEGLHPKTTELVREACDGYADAVIQDEWHTMQLGEASDKAQAAIWGLWLITTHLEPKTESEKAIHQVILDQMTQLSDNRRNRLVNSSHGVDPLMWAILILGGVFTVVFTYFFGVENVKAQIVMTVIMAITLSLNVFVVFVFGYPFATDLGVKPEAMRLNTILFEKIGMIKEGKISPSESLLDDFPILRELKDIREKKRRKLLN